MDFAQRDALLEEDPSTYYLKDHYRDYLVRARAAVARASRMRCGISFRARIDS
jgi:hypothetical protein